jgi:hypothetical protein
MTVRIENGSAPPKVNSIISFSALAHGEPCPAMGPHIKRYLVSQRPIFRAGSDSQSQGTPEGRRKAAPTAAAPENKKE